MRRPHMSILWTIAALRLGAAALPSATATPRWPTAGNPPLLRETSAAAAAAVRRATGVCGGAPFYDSLMRLHGPLANCTPMQLFEAVKHAVRPARDAPLHITGCSLYWFTPAHACDALEAAGGLVLSGDSLVRHLIQALLTVLVGDYTGTTDVVAAPAEMRGRVQRPAGAPSCTCNAAYDEGHRPREPNPRQRRKWREATANVHRPREQHSHKLGRRLATNASKSLASPVRSSQALPPKLSQSARLKYCREASVAYVVTGSGEQLLQRMRTLWPSICPSWNVSFIGSRDVLRDGRGVDGRHGIYYRSGGLHFPRLDGTVIEQLFPRELVRRSASRNESSLVCGLLHAPGEKKPVKYLKSHGAKATDAFNKAITARCSGRGVVPFDAFTATYKTFSHDGQHYGVRTNVLLAHLLLNVVEALTREPRM